MTKFVFFLAKILGEKEQLPSVITERKKKVHIFRSTISSANFTRTNP